MSEQYIKFLKKLQAKQRKQFEKAIIAIKENNLQNHDVIELTNHKNLFRLRIGKYRIIFQKDESETKIIKIQKRGVVYKNI